LTVSACDRDQLEQFPVTDETSKIASNIDNVYFPYSTFGRFPQEETELEAMSIRVFNEKVRNVSPDNPMQDSKQVTRGKQETAYIPEVNNQMQMIQRRASKKVIGIGTGIGTGAAESSDLILGDWMWSGPLQMAAENMGMSPLLSRQAIGPGSRHRLSYRRPKRTRC
jgi:hypothetical protein